MMNTSAEGKEFSLLLRNKNECSVFRSFVKKAACDENLMFWIEIELHKKEVQVFGGNFKVEFARKRNEELWTKYFKPGGAYELNVDSDAVDDIRGKLFQGTEEEANSLHLFDRAQDEVYLLMLNDSYAKFKKSNEYLLYLQKIEAEQAKIKKHHKKKSNSFHNTPSVGAALIDYDKPKKRNSITGLSKLFSKSTSSAKSQASLPTRTAEDDLFTNDRAIKISNTPNRRTFSGLNHFESTDSMQSPSPKLRARANSLEEIEIKEFDKKHLSITINGQGEHKTWEKMNSDLPSTEAMKAQDEASVKPKKVSVVRSRIRHSINSIRAFFASSSQPTQSQNLQRERLRSQSSVAAMNPASLRNGTVSKSSPALGSATQSMSSPPAMMAEITRSTSDLIFDAFFLSTTEHT